MNGFSGITHWVSGQKSRPPFYTSGRTGFLTAQLLFLGLSVTHYYIAENWASANSTLETMN